LVKHDVARTILGHSSCVGGKQKVMSLSHH